MITEQEWEQDKLRFLRFTGSVPNPAVSDDTEFNRRRGDFGPLAAQFAVLATQLFSAGTAADVLDKIIYATAELVPEADLVSITLRKKGGSFETPVTTHDLALRLDEVQYEAQEGPCVEATRQDGIGFSEDADLGASDHWPLFGPAAAKLGVRSVLSFGLMPTSPAPRLGALNLYAYPPHALLDVDRNIGLLLAAHAGAAIAAARSLETADLRVAQLERALLSRDVIGQAKGMLMAHRGVNAEEAFDILRTASQHLNIKLAAIAEAITTGRVKL